MGVRIARKHLGWYSRAYPDTADFCARIFTVDSAAEQLRLTHDYFACPA